MATDTPELREAFSLPRAAGALLRRRPGSAPAYAARALRFALNHLFWRAAASERIRIGRNLHLLTTAAFQAERPDARIRIGNDFVGYSDIRLCAWGRGEIEVGDCCSVGSGSRIHARSGVRLGHHVLMSWDVLVMDFDGHALDPVQRSAEMERSLALSWPRFGPRRPPPSLPPPPVPDARPIAIGDCAWVGARAIILKGVTIGSGAVIAAGAVVTHDVPDRVIAAGNPARVVKEIR